MRIIGTICVSLLTMAAVLAAPALSADSQPAVSSGELVVIGDFDSQFVPARDVYVWLPDDFDENGEYAVLYMHDGDMLFDAAVTWNGQEWGVDEVASRLMAEQAVRDFIVVGVPNAGPERNAEYLPEQPVRQMEPAQREAWIAGGGDAAAELRDTLRSDSYLRFLVEELKPYIDLRFPVLSDPANTFIMGSSMGGLISIYALARYPDVFGGAGCLSTHWPGALPGRESPFPAAMRDFLAGSLPGGKRVWFDHGTEGLDAAYPELQRGVDAVMREKGYDQSNWVTYVDEGADHSEDAWRARLQLPLTFLLAPPEDRSLAAVSSPDGRLRFTLNEGRFGGKTYSLAFGSETIVRNARLGMRFAKQHGFDRGLELVSVKTNSHDSTWEQPWGERRVVRDRHEELLLSLQNPQGGRIDLRVRVFDDGLGFRYEVPEQEGIGTLHIVDELTEFALPENSTAWWIPGRRYNRYEYLYRTTGLEGIETAHSPFTLRTPRGTHVSIHEAALVDYAGFVLDQRRPGVFQANLTPWSDGVRVKTAAPFKTPWRTIQVADAATGLLNSSLILNLNEPNALGDVSWVQPGKYVGIWWAMHIKRKTWGSGIIHGATTAETKRYMDFAAKHGFDGVLVEGWNVGWDGDWFHNGDLFSFTESYPDFDIDEVTRYGLEKGVRLIGHHETSGNVSNYASQMADAYDLYEKLGVSQVKTGYVADGGDIRRIDENGIAQYEWHDGQFMVGEYLRSVTEAAKRRISINTHEPVKDTGLRRTYPNWLTREGAKGQEFNAWGNPPNPPEHTAILPYTRLLAGPMDFTPGIFDLAFDGLDWRHRVRTTLAKQLALYVTLYSPVHMAADLPENYEARPDVFQFIVDVPTDWEESIAVAGEVGEYVAFARQERGGPDWYLGAVTDSNERDLSIALDFLEAGHVYTAHVYRDGAGADWKSNPYPVAIEKRIVTNDDVMELWLAPGGGAAVRFEASGDIVPVSVDRP
jgi:alpha-glucosidase